MSRATPQLATLLAASAAVWASIARLDAISSAHSVLTFLAWLAAAFVLYAAASALVLRSNSAGQLALAVWGGVLFRLLLLPAGLPPGTSWFDMPARLGEDLRGARVVYERFLLFDDDAWRYLWDGHVFANGLNPYLRPPADPALDDLVEAPRRGPRAAWSDVRDNVNHPEVPTLYPPLAQGSFRLAHALAPGSVLALKLVLVAADLAAALFVGLTLRALDRPLAGVLLYLWNPLVIKAFAGSAHADSLAVAALAATMWLIVCGRRFSAAVGFGLATLAKLAPLVLLPLVARRIGPRATALAGLVIAAGYAPFLEPGVFDGLLSFGTRWRFNGGSFLGLVVLLEPWLEDPERAARALCLGAALVFSVHVALRDDGCPVSFPAAAASVLGVLLILSPAVMPWYVTWLVPLAAVAGSRTWLCFSGLVCLAFLVMIDGRERPFVLLLEYGSLATLAAIPCLLRSIPWRIPMLKKSPAVVVFLLCLGPMPVLAQGSGSTGVGREPSFQETPNFQVLRSLEGEIESLDEREGVLVVVHTKSGARMRFRIDPKIRLKADKKSEFAGRKDLVVSEFKAGHPVRLTFRTRDFSAVELKLRAPKS